MVDRICQRLDKSQAKIWPLATPRPPPDIFTSATGREPTNKRFSFRITKTTSLTKKQIAEHLVKGN
jgi:hypothetical protein